MSAAADQVKAAMALMGRDIRFAHQPDGPVHRVLAVNARGMVTLYDMAGEFAPHLFVSAEQAPAAAPAMPPEAAVALPPAVAADGSTAELATGEILLLPGELWQAIDAGCAAAAALEAAPVDAPAAGDDAGGGPAPRRADGAALRTAFAGAFAQALHRAGLLLLKAADPKSTQSVSVQTYSLALQGKHTAEARLAALALAIRGWSSYAPCGASGALAKEGCRQPLLSEMAAGVLALAGRAPPDERRRLHGGFVRLRAIAALVEGSPTAGWDIANAPPLPAELLAFIEGKDAA